MDLRIFPYKETTNIIIRDENRYYSLIPDQWPDSEEKHKLHLQLMNGDCFPIRKHLILPLTFKNCPNLANIACNFGQQNPKITIV